MEEMYAAERGHKSRGMNHYNAKLGSQDIPIIHKQFASGVSQSELARTYGVTPQCIWQIVNNKSWKDAA
jgi:DNA invertase Pin-like site-specific DNA recombinase